MLPVRTIVCPTDFSDRAAPAVELATALARDYSAELVLVHVTPPPVQVVSGGVLVGVPVDSSAEAAHLDAVRVADPRVVVRRLTAVGPPATEIVRLAREQGADLIVMGTHGRGGLARVLVGSVAEAVMRHAPCPVLTVRSPFPPPAAAPHPAALSSCLSGASHVRNAQPAGDRPEVPDEEPTDGVAAVPRTA